MKFGKHPRRLPAEEWFQHRFANVLPVDGEPTDPENCPGGEVLRSYALKEKGLVLDAPTLHILDCPRCRRKVAEIRQELQAAQNRHEREQVRRFMKATGLALLFVVVLGVFSLILKAGWFSPRSTPVTLDLVSGRANQKAATSFSMPAALVALHVHLPPESTGVSYEVGVLPKQSTVASAVAVVKPVRGVDGQELNLSLDLRHVATGTYVLFLRSSENSMSYPLQVHQP